LYFFAAFAALVLGTHLPYLNTPFFWDEVGQYIPSALDLYRDGAWIPRSAPAIVHPPGLAAILAAVWRTAGFSIAATRVTMLVIASAGVLFSFLLAIRLARGAAGAPAFAAVLLLLVTPLFFTQAMMAQLDMPVMALTALALLLFLNGRQLACAAVCTAAVFFKETAITTPAVFALWLWFREGRRREAAYFVAPAFVLAIWFLALHRATGHWLGDPAVAQYNLIEPLRPAHLAMAIVRRAYYLFIADGRWIGSVALFAGWRLLQTRDWAIAGLVAAAQVAVVTIFGGATLERYLLPALPVLYAAAAVASSAYPASWRWAANSAMIAVLFFGWFWDPPYPSPYENNLAMMDTISLHKQAAEFLEAFGTQNTIATGWPLDEELSRPEYGYISQRLRIEPIPGFELTQIANLQRAQTLVVYSRFPPFEGWPGEARLRQFLVRYLGYKQPAPAETIEAGVGFRPAVRFVRGSQWLEIYVRE
jgi:hypothetical protein